MVLTPSMIRNELPIARIHTCWSNKIVWTALTPNAANRSNRRSDGEANNHALGEVLDMHWDIRHQNTEKSKDYSAWN